MADDEVEYRFEKGKGWVAHVQKPIPTNLGSMQLIPGLYDIEPGYNVADSNGQVIGYVLSYSNGVATIQLTSSIQHVTINATLEI